MLLWKCVLITGKVISQTFFCVFKGKEIIEYFIDQLKQEGITYVAPWKETHPEVASAEDGGSGDADTEKAKTR